MRGVSFPLPLATRCNTIKWEHKLFNLRFEKKERDDAMRNLPAEIKF